MNDIIDPAPTQHIFRDVLETKKPVNTGVTGFKMVEAAGVEPASENDHPRLLHTYLKI